MAYVLAIIWLIVVAVTAVRQRGRRVILGINALPWLACTGMLTLAMLLTVIEDTDQRAVSAFMFVPPLFIVAVGTTVASLLGWAGGIIARRVAASRGVR